MSGHKNLVVIMGGHINEVVNKGNDWPFGHNKRGCNNKVVVLTSQHSWQNILHVVEESRMPREEWGGVQ